MFKQTSLKFYMLYQKFQKLQIFMLQNVLHEVQHLLQMCFTLSFFQILHISNYFKAFQCLENKLEISQCLKGFKNFDQAMFQMWKTLEFWHVSFIMFGQAMFQNILCVLNVKNFEVLVCCSKSSTKSCFKTFCVFQKCDFFWNSHVWNECKNFKILRKQDWNFMSCERLVLGNFQFF